MPIITDLDKFRLELGDTEEDRALLNDDECQYFIDRRPGRLLLAVADACDALANKFSSEFDVEWQGSTDARGRYSRSQKAKMFADRAVALRRRAMTEGPDDGSTVTSGAPWHTGTGCAAFRRGQFDNQRG